MNTLRFLLIFFAIYMNIYTGYVIYQDGIAAITVFFSDIAALDWRGQFNSDFSTYIALSALWIAWRGHFSTGSILLSFASVLGMAFFAPYLLFLSVKAKGNISTLLIGEKRAKFNT